MEVFFTAPLAAILGGTLASFASTLAWRMAQGESAPKGRSRCDHCQKLLGFHETIPVISFALFRGRCRLCDGPISKLHLAAEGAGCVAAFAAAWLTPWPLWPWAAFLLIVLVYVATFDALTMRIPNPANLGIASAGLGLAIAEGKIVEAVSTGSVTAVILFAMQALFVRSTGRAGLGTGDVKLIAALAIWTGTDMTPWAVVLAGAMGLGWLALRGELRSKQRLAFAPAIAVGFGMAFIAGRAGWTR